MVTRGRQSGIALLMVMVIVALATLLGVELIRQQQLQTHRAANLLHGDQAFEYALGGEVWAKRLLIKDAADSKHDSLDEFWNQGLPPTPIPGGTIGGRLRDLQGHFNLNNLQLGTTPNALAGERFSRLLSGQGLPSEIAEAARDWLDTDNQVLAIGGAEDDYYSRLPDPYRAANRPMADITELRLLRGVNEAAYAALAPLVIVLPEQTAINVNTAPSPVLQSLGLNEGEAQVVLQARDEQAFETLKQFTDLPVIDAAIRDGRIDVGNLTISSRFFELQTEVRIGDLYFVQYSLLARNGSNSVDVIARRRRGW